MKALVTGGGGFLGEAIVRQLRARGDEVRSFARGDYPALTALGVEVLRGDLRDPSAVARAAAGCDVVFHVAAKPGVWGPAKDFHETNVVGTENVVAACVRGRVARLVYTSSPSVIFGGGPIEGGDESLPYPTRFLAHYPRTKAIAERHVLAANSAALRTVSLRPHLIWGPGDNHLVPRIVARARKGQLRKIGSGAAKVDSVYVDNAAEAHLLAADALAMPCSPVAGPPIPCRERERAVATTNRSLTRAAGNDGVERADPAGKAYFITNGEPVPIGDLIDRILRAAGLPKLERSIPAGVAYAAGFASELVYGALGIAREPRMTRFLAKQLSTAHWFDLGAARRDLGYAPRVSIDEGMERLGAWLRSDAFAPARDL
jgi:nucleoside-diphosphate-sugar epimerase